MVWTTFWTLIIERKYMGKKNGRAKFVSLFDVVPLNAMTWNYNRTVIMHIYYLKFYSIILSLRLPLAIFENSLILGFNVQENKNIFIKPLSYRDKCVLFVLYVFTNCIFVLHAHVLKPFFITCFRFEEILFDIRMSVFKNMRKGQRS